MSMIDLTYSTIYIIKWKIKTVQKVSDPTKVSEEKFSVFLSSQLNLFEFNNIKRIMPRSGHSNVQERTNLKFIFFMC